MMDVCVLAFLALCIVLCSGNKTDVETVTTMARINNQPRRLVVLVVNAVDD